MKDKKSASLFQKEQVMESLKQSFVKLDPRVMIKNPIVFTVELVTLVMLVVCILSLGTTEYGTFGYNFLVFVVLFVTLLFANFAEAIAEARGKAQADSLRKTREETPAKILIDGKVCNISSARLKKGDYFICEAGDTIPADGEIVEGLASIDESAITGESAPVIREAGGDKSSVTGGTKVLSDKIKVLVTQQQGESFLDKMIALVEGATRKKTPNEIARHADSNGGLYKYRASGNVYLDCSYSFPVCLPDTDHDRWPAFCYRHCRYGPCASCQCDNEIG